MSLLERKKKQKPQHVGGMCCEGSERDIQTLWLRKGHTNTMAGKDLGQVSSPKIYTYVYLISSQTIYLLGDINKSAGWLSDLEENSGNDSCVEAELYRSGSG